MIYSLSNKFYNERILIQRILSLETSPQRRVDWMFQNTQWFYKYGQIEIVYDQWCLSSKKTTKPEWKQIYSDSNIFFLHHKNKINFCLQFNAMNWLLKTNLSTISSTLQSLKQKYNLVDHKAICDVIISPCCKAEQPPSLDHMASFFFLPLPSFSSLCPFHFSFLSISLLSFYFSFFFSYFFLPLSLAFSFSPTHSLSRSFSSASHALFSLL